MELSIEQIATMDLDAAMTLWACTKSTILISRVKDQVIALTPGWKTALVSTESLKKYGTSGSGSHVKIPVPAGTLIFPSLAGRMVEYIVMAKLNGGSLASIRFQEI